ncbi:MAG: iron ABC transporter permease [Desulfamplus sp.]|nr:iron ABC transporter permease [Desulfamplus sp.]
MSLVAVGSIPILFFGIFYLYPLAGIFIRSFFHDEHGFNLYNLFKIFQSPRILGVIWFTIWQAVLSTILTLIVALPCSYVMGQFDFRFKRLIMTLATIPFVLPTVVVAASFQVISYSIEDAILLLSDGSLISLFKSNNPILMVLFAHIFYNFSVVLRITSSFFSSIGKETTEAAQMLGADSLQIFFKVTLPLLKPAIFASAMLVFIFCFSSFGVILILGGASISTIEVEIYRQAAHLFNLPVASSLSIFQIVFTFIMLFIYSNLQKKRAMFTPESEKFSLKKPSSISHKILIFFCSLFIVCLCGIPMVALLIKSISYKGSISLIFYQQLFLNSSGSIFYVSPVTAISNSLTFAFITLLMSLFVAVSAASLIKDQGKLFEPIFMLPLSTSAVTLGFGIIITLDKPPLNLRTSTLLIPIVHTLVASPFVIRAILPAIRSIPQNLKEAASMLGASPFKVWLYVEMPIIARALSIGAIFAFTVSIGEFGASLFAARPEFTTMPVTIYKFLGQPGVMNYGQAMAMSSILMLVTASGFLFIERIRQFGHEGF